MMLRNNRVSHDVDKVAIKEFEKELEYNLRVLLKSLRAKTYRPKPVRRVFIPKADVQNVH
jgi:RNA-directed DNA polymerase